MTILQNLGKLIEKRKEKMAKPIQFVNINNLTNILSNIFNF
jgi:hypothetical protein